jgi:hypothetical protein
MHIRMPLSPKERHSKVTATWVPSIFLRIFLLCCLCDLDFCFIIYFCLLTIEEDCFLNFGYCFKCLFFGLGLAGDLFCW